MIIKDKECKSVSSDRANARPNDCLAPAVVGVQKDPEQIEDFLKRNPNLSESDQLELRIRFNVWQ